VTRPYPECGNSPATTVQAIAVGGGLAGAAFALELARNGIEIVLFERTAVPQHKVCGEFLSEGAQVLLRYLGIEVADLGASRIEALCLANGSKRVFAPLPFKAVGLSRLVLDEELLGVAQRSGAMVVRDTTVEGLETTASGIFVRTTRGDFVCQSAALASGKHNVRGLPRPAGHMVGFKIQIEAAEQARAALRNIVYLNAFSGGYVGLCLVERSILSIAWIIEAAILKSVGTSWDEQSRYIAKQSPCFGELIDGAAPLWPRPLAVSGLAFGYMRSAPIGASVYPVGDQLAVIPSFSGDGTALALASGIAAAQAVLRGEGAGQFQRRMLASFNPQFRRAAILDAVIANAMLRRVGMAGARFVPSAVTGIVSATRIRGLDELIGSRHTRL
jgi:flavin-dependent dehydrogenase